MKDETNQARLPFGGKDAGDESNPRSFVLSSNWAIGGLLSRGALVAPALSEQTGSPFFDDDHGDMLLASRGGLPSAWCDDVRKTSRNSFPIALEISLEHVHLSETQGLSSIGLENVIQLVFETDEEATLFTNQGFEDWNLDEFGIPYTVDASIFGDGTPLVVAPAPQKPQGALADHRSSIERADGWAALLAIAPRVLPGKGKWITALEALFNDSEPLDDVQYRWLAAVKSGIEQDSETKYASLEEALLSVTTLIATTEYGHSVGWPATEILDRIISETEKVHPAALDDEHAVAWRKWGDRCKNILNGTEEPFDMLDAHRIPHRAVLFLLLRERVDAIIGMKSRNSALRVGPQVRALAALMAACRTGLRRLPVKLKLPHGGGQPRTWLNHLGRRFLTVHELPEGREDRSPGRISSKYRSIGVLQGEWVFQEGRKELFRVARETDSDLVRIHAMGASMGYVFDESDDKGLKTTFEWKNGRSQTVYVELMEPVREPGRFIRFWSPALSLAPARKVNSPAWPTAKLKGLKIQGLVHLLEMNAEAGMKCRYAIDREKQAVIVLVDQILSTLDEQEFRQHLEHVASVADGYERAMGVDDFK